MKNVKLFLAGGMMFLAITGLAQTEKPSDPPPLPHVAPPQRPPLPPPPDLADLKRFKHPHLLTARWSKDIVPPAPPLPPPPPPPPAPPTSPEKGSE